MHVFSPRCHSLTLIALLWSLSNLAMAADVAWVATWTASPEASEADPDEPLMNLHDQTVRERVRLSVGGKLLRLRVSNEYGSGPLHVQRASVALAQSAVAIVPGSLRPVTFSGRSATVIPPGTAQLSDPVDFTANDDAEISVSLYLKNHPAGVTWHGLAMKRTVISPPGDHTQDATIRHGKESDASAFLSAVLVPAQPGQRVIVAFGDSIVDGDGSTPDADRTWPNDLFRRLAMTDPKARIAVVNEGVAGNRLLADGPLPMLGIAGLARFERDALSVPGVTDIVLLEGTNDIGFPGAKLGDVVLAASSPAPSAEDLIGAYRQLIARAHARGVRLIGATIMPSRGAVIAGYHTEAKERIRQQVNQWIRSSGEFDGVIDFDAVVRDPAHPDSLAPDFASKDHLHPNDAGYQAMANAIELALFRMS
jgi:lysophospholipase L1-like esterase